MNSPFRLSLCKLDLRPWEHLLNYTFRPTATPTVTINNQYKIANIKIATRFKPLLLILYVCTTFRGNRSCDFGFRTRKPPRKFGVKSGLSQKRLMYGKKYFIGLYVSRYPFIPTNSLLAAMRFISFFFPFFPFFFFFLPKFCRPTLFFS